MFLDHQRKMSGIEISRKYKLSATQTYRIIKKMEKNWKIRKKPKELQTTLGF